jgi:hypothetical protein
MQETDGSFGYPSAISDAKAIGNADSTPTTLKGLNVVKIVSDVIYLVNKIIDVYADIGYHHNKLTNRKKSCLILV